MNKKYLLLLLAWGLVASGISLYLWIENQKLRELNISFSESNQVHRRLIENEVESYRTIYDCFVVNRGQCNPDGFKNKLQTLGDEAEGLYGQISILDKQLQETNK